MGGLGGTMHDGFDVGAVALKKALHRIFIADVRIDMTVSGDFPFQQFQVPSRRSLGSKKLGAHVVVNADNVHALLCEKPHSF